MPKKTSDETDDSGQPKRTLGKKGSPRQPPPPKEPRKRPKMTEVTFQEKQNPEEEDRDQ